MIDVALYRRKLEQTKGKLLNLTSEIEDLELEITAEIKQLHRHEHALEIVKAVSIATQERLQFHISEITSLAMDAVFALPYKVEAEFVERRNKIECDLYFTRGGERISPTKEAGGGALDVAAFALRIACYTMMRQRSSPVIILDEPFRFLSKDMQERAALLLKELSTKLGIQFIIVTHEKQLTNAADKVFEITKTKRISKANEITTSI